MQPSNLTLASASPRRKKLLRQIGLEFSVMPSHVDETVDNEVSPEEHVMILAERKATDVAMRLPSGIVVGADTVVVLDGEIINKPVSPEDAVRMLRRLSGVKHTVYTGFTILEAPSRRTVTEYERTDVWFRALENDEILAYVASGSPMDKAGAYGIQDDFGAVFVQKINGDYYNVVGMPLCHFYTAFRTFMSKHELPNAEKT